MDRLLFNALVRWLWSTSCDPYRYFRQVSRLTHHLCLALRLSIVLSDNVGIIEGKSRELLETIDVAVDFDLRNVSPMPSSYYLGHRYSVLVWTHGRGW